MLIAALADAAKLLLIAAGFYFGLGVYLRRARPPWSAPLEKRRLVLASLIVLAVLIVDVTEDTLGGDSGPVDTAILMFVHRHIGSGLRDFFAAVTFTGSANVLVPLTIVATLALALTNHRREAVLLFASLTTGALVIYFVKVLVARDRPALWATDLYWGSSFPSGHTLIVASFATAASLCVSRIRPALHRSAASLGLAWVVLVALSRLVIGVHWPTDVLAAACIGAFIPLAIGLALELKFD
jgi:membrane-associated phospholipid phosphatase